ncbi:MAG TPA: hypothetical protein VK171_08615 [Fimbriimonas sp.]|nr:hypothetical protein [Fimbriimonas sp.]
MFSYMLASNSFRPSGVSMADARMVAEQTTQTLELRIQSLELTCAALWTILKEQNGYTDDQLVRAIHEVDARDGVVDGKITQSAKVCPHCNRKVLTRNPTKCAWCGGDLGVLGPG